MTSLGGKHILITGASSGIGTAVAILSSKQSQGNIFVCGRDPNRLNALINHPEIVEKSAVIPFLGDLTDPVSLSSLVQTITTRAVKLDCLVFCAGLDKVMPFKMANQKVMEDTMRINTIIPIELFRLLLKAGLINDNASVVFVSSVMGLLGQQGQIAYCTSKGALISATKALALELAGNGIRVNVIAPGIVNTEMTRKLFSSMSPEGVKKILEMHPLGFGEPEDVAELVAFLFSDKSKWITGSTIPIDGGYSAH